MARYLRETYLPHASIRDGVGPDRYQLNSRFYNGITLDLEETYRWGWDGSIGSKRRCPPPASASCRAGACTPPASLESDPAGR